MVEVASIAGSGVFVPPARPVVAPKIKGLTLPLAACKQPYAGRVSTFYNSATGVYCENYEPARVSQFGPIGRIESRLIDGARRHVAYKLSGEQIYGPNDDLLILDETTLPLMFDPEKEQQFAEACLSMDSTQDLFHYNKGVVIYRNKDNRAVGIVRLKNSPEI